MKGRLILVRHGESEGNAERRFSYSPELPLTDLGRAQARQTGEAIRAGFAPVRLVASPFRRAQHTAEIIGEIIGLPVDIEPDVREFHLGDLHGRSYDAVAETEGYETLKRWEWRPPGPGGETLLELQERAVPVIQRLAAEHAAEDIVVVSHGGTMQAIRAWVEQSWEAIGSIPNCSLLVVPHDGKEYGEPELLETPGGAG